MKKAITIKDSDGLKFSYCKIYCLVCVISTSMSSATEALLSTADTAITNTAIITVVNLNPRGDDFLIMLFHYFLLTVYLLISCAHLVSWLKLIRFRKVYQVKTLKIN